MNEKETIEAFTTAWKDPKTRYVAKQIAIEYVNENREFLTKTLGKFSQDDLVKLIDAYRVQNRLDDVVIADMWLLSEYEPKDIRGELTIGAKQVIEEAMRVIRGE